MASTRHVILLSTKSAGSTAFQKYLEKNYGFKLLPFTPHQENETLFRTKAASVLGLPQEQMVNIVVPYSAERGAEALRTLLSGNGVATADLSLDKAGIFRAYREMVVKNGPLFLKNLPTTSTTGPTWN